MPDLEPSKFPFPEDLPGVRYLRLGPFLDVGGTLTYGKDYGEPTRFVVTAQPLLLGPEARGNAVFAAGAIVAEMLRNAATVLVWDLDAHHGWSFTGVGPSWLRTIQGELPLCPTDWESYFGATLTPDDFPSPQELGEHPIRSVRAFEALGGVAIPPKNLRKPDARFIVSTHPAQYTSEGVHGNPTEAVAALWALIDEGGWMMRVWDLMRSEGWAFNAVGPEWLGLTSLRWQYWLGELHQGLAETFGDEDET